MRIQIPWSIVGAVALAGCASAPVAPRADLLGMPVPDPAAAQETIVITSATRWLNVTGGDTIRFVAGQQAFTWNFQVSPQVAMFDLNQVAPPGMLTRRIPVYITPDPLYGSGG